MLASKGEQEGAELLSDTEGHGSGVEPGAADIDRFLRDKFSKLQVAINEFKPYLTQKQQIAFGKAWFIYRMGEDGREIDKQSYWQYMPHSGSSKINGVEVEFDNTKTYQVNFKRARKGTGHL